MLSISNLVGSIFYFKKYMYRAGYKRSLAPKTPQKTSFKRPKYGGNRPSYGNKSFYGRRTRLAVGSGKCFLGSRSLKDEVFTSEEGLGRSNPKGEYVTFPAWIGSRCELQTY